MLTVASIAVIIASVTVLVGTWRQRPRKLVGEPLKASLGRMKTFGDPWSSLGPATGTLAVGTGGGVKTIAAYYKRQSIRLSLDTAVTTAVVYGLLNPGSGAGQNGTASATNFHFSLSTTQPPLELEYTGAIQLVANAGTIQVGVIEG